jgi:putative DNA primase/helicase
VDGAALLDEVTSAIHRYVVLRPHEADAVALWVLAVHAFNAWHIFPRLLVTAPEMRCGKTTLLDLLLRLVPRPLGASNVTAAALFRTIEAARPTFLLDEADAWARHNEDLRSIIDGGHKRDASVVRTVGDNHEPRQFSLWAPMALAAIGHLARTIADRAIIIRLRRRRPDEPIESLRLYRTGKLDILGRKAARWAVDNAAALAAADPPMPDGIYSRDADNWCPLLAVADLASGGWPARAREAAVTLTHAGTDDNDSTRELLLADLRELFAAEQSGVLFTAEILAALHKDETRPWAEYGKARKPITDVQLAALLKPYGIRPKTVRRGIRTDKGYRREWLEDTFARYLPAFPAVTPSQMRDSAALGDSPAVTWDLNVTAGNRENPSISASCDGVTGRNPLWWREDGDPEPGPDDVVWDDADE